MEKKLTLNKCRF